MFFGSAHAPNVIAANDLIENLEQEILSDLIFAGPVCGHIPNGPWKRLGTLSLENLERELCDGAILVNPIFMALDQALR